jgi:hypothetical protein
MRLMKPSFRQHNDFLAHKPLPGVSFEHDDRVHVITGPHVGDTGNIVSVEELGEDPLYLVELDTGHDQLIGQSALRKARQAL